MPKKFPRTKLKDILKKVLQRVREIIVLIKSIVVLTYGNKQMCRYNKHKLQGFTCQLLSATDYALAERLFEGTTWQS